MNKNHPMSILFKGNKMKSIKSRYILLFSLFFVFVSFDKLFSNDTIVNVRYPLIKNGIIYVYGYIGQKGNNPPYGSYIKEFDEITHDSLRYIEFPNYYINNIDVDSKGNKYIFSGALNKDAVADFLVTDFIRVIDHKMILSKISANNDTIFYKTVIPATDDIYTKIKINSDDKLIFIASTLPRDQYYKDPNFYFTPDSIYVISENAIQKKRCVSTRFHLGVDLYIGILSQDGKNIEYGTFWGGMGDDFPLDLEIANNGDLAILGIMRKSTTRGSDPSATLNGKFPCTEGAIQSALTLSDSLNNNPDIYLDLGIQTLSILNLEEQKVKYASYWTFGRTMDIKFDSNNSLFIAAWLKENNYGFPKGSFIANVNYEDPSKWIYHNVSPNDYLDTIWYQEEYPSDVAYWLKANRDVFFDLDKDDNIYFCGMTMDPTHPVTENAKQKSYCDSTDLVIYKFDKNFNIKYCSYYGSTGADIIWYIKLSDNNPNNFFIYAYSEDDKYPQQKICKSSASNNYITEYTIGELGINDTYKDYGFTIYPNPCSDFINIEPELNSSKIEIYNSIGEKVAEYSQVQKLDISNYPSGIYTIKSGNKTKSFVKI